MAFETTLSMHIGESMPVDMKPLVTECYYTYPEVSESWHIEDFLNRVSGSYESVDYGWIVRVRDTTFNTTVATALVWLDEWDFHVQRCVDVKAMYIAKNLRGNREIVRRLFHGIRSCYPDEKWLCYGIRNKHGHTEIRYRRQHGKIKRFKD